MASLTHSQNRSLTQSVTDGIRRLRARFDAHMAVMNERRRIARELSVYSDDELAELGFSRLDIPAVAAGSYRR